MFRGTDLFQRSKYGINYPYIFPENKEIEDKIPTITIANFTEIDGGPYPSSSRGPIQTLTDTTTWVKGRHTIKGGIVFEYSGEDDFDQINVQPIPGSTNNQNGRVRFSNGGANRTGVAVADAALGLFDSYAEIGQRALTKWRALASDMFVQDSWRPTSKLTVEGGVRYVLWPPWYSTTNNIANFDPSVYSTSNQAVINPANGQIVSGPRYNGIVLPGDGFPSSREQPRRLQRPGGDGAVQSARRAASPRRTRTCSNRASACRMRSTRRRSSAPAPACSTTASR